MNENNVKIISNWPTIKRGSWNETLVCKYLSGDISAENRCRPDLNDIVSDERVLIISTDTEVDEHQSCEVNIQAFPKFKFGLVSLVADCQKLELFLGKEKQYRDTMYGSIEDDFEDVQVYRFDIDVGSSEFTDLTIKLLPKSNIICIFGIHVYLLPNPNGIRNCLLPSSINLDNVQSMLDNSNLKRSPSAEKCKSFLQTYMKMGLANRLNNISPEIATQLTMGAAASDIVSISESFNSKLQLDNGNAEKEGIKTGEDSGFGANFIVAGLKNHLDSEISRVETRLMERLTLIEEKQNKKLDEILDLLKNKKGD